MSAKFNSTGNGVIFESAHDIPMQSPQWIWKDWIYRGKAHILAGPPSTGKTTIAMAIAATISMGGAWPDGSPSPRGRVVIWSSEDGIEDTIIPRLAAAGADLRYVEVVRQTEERWLRRLFDPVRDLSLLEERIQQLGDVALLIIDSIADLMPGSPGNNNKVRKSLLPLVGLAERTGCAVLGLTHVVKASKKKHPLERIIGGVGLGAVVRVAMLVARDDSGGFGEVREWSVLVKAKANICREDGGFLYRTEGRCIPTSVGSIESSKVEWGAQLAGSAMDILNRAEQIDPNAGGAKIRAACDFLMGALNNGPRPGTEVEAMAAAVGISNATLRRAREQLGIASQKTRNLGSASQNLWSWAGQNGGINGVGTDLGISMAVAAPAASFYYQSPLANLGPKIPISGASCNGFSFSRVFKLDDPSNFVTQTEQVEQAGQVEQTDQAERVGDSVARSLGFLTAECRQAYESLKRHEDEDGPEDELDFRQRVIEFALRGVDLDKQLERNMQDALDAAFPW